MDRVRERLRPDLDWDVGPLETARCERGVLHPRRERAGDRLPEQRHEPRRGADRHGPLAPVVASTLMRYSLVDEPSRFRHARVSHACASPG